jgi:tetrahydromethanopterin S-methyltransferase subunit G
MDEKILPLLNQILEGQKDTTKRLDRIEKKLDATVEQTADLTEFRTEVNAKLEDIKSDFTNVEVITASNWKDIARLKAVK